MGLDKVSSIPIKGLTAQELMDYFIEKIESIRKSTGGSKASTRLPAATSTLSSFEEYSAEDIQKIIESSPTVLLLGSCANLDLKRIPARVASIHYNDV